MTTKASKLDHRIKDLEEEIEALVAALRHLVLVCEQNDGGFVSIQKKVSLKLAKNALKRHA